MAEEIIIPPIPATVPEVVPPTPEKVYNIWFPTGIRIDWQGGKVYNVESFFQIGNATEAGTRKVNHQITNILSKASLEEQFGADFLQANPDIEQAIPLVLSVLVKLAYRKEIL